MDVIFWIKLIAFWAFALVFCLLFAPEGDTLIFGNKLKRGTVIKIMYLFFWILSSLLILWGVI